LADLAPDPFDEVSADYSFELRGGYYFGQLERLIKDLQPLFEITEPGLVKVDLSGVAFIAPTATALLLATLMRLRDAGCGVDVRGPNNPLTDRFLMRSDFVRQFLDRDDVEEPFERKEPAGFRPCAHFVTDEECIAVSRDLSDALIEKAPTDKGARGAIKTALHELAENVIFHADTPLGGYAAAVYSRRRKEIEIGIVDLGIGIRASLTKNPDYAHLDNDVDAIETAMIPTISSTPERNSGFGLFFTQSLLLINGGSLRVRSGYGAATIGPGIDYSAREHHLPGTMVVLRARTDRPLDAAEAWRLLEEAIQDVLRNDPATGDDTATP
jgi:anti-sigma regulatory factor (Ser/Thr protein kinase)